MKGRVEIRPVRINDLREIYLLGSEFFAPHHHPFPQAWNEETLADAIADDPGLSLVAIIKKCVAGFLIASLDEGGAIRTAAIRWFCAPPSRPASLKDELLHEFASTIALSQIDKIIITLPDDNSELIEYFRNFGFTDSKRFIIMENFLPKKP
jgi:hypothetical protein